MNDFYHQIKESEYAKIEVSYSLGGRDYFTGNNERRGIYVFFMTVEKSKTGESYRPFASGNFKILAVELNRFSKKKMQAIVDWVRSNEEQLFQLYLNQDKTRLFEMVTGIDLTGEKKKVFMKKHDQLVDRLDAGQLSDEEFCRAEKELEQKYDIFGYSKQRS